MKIASMHIVNFKAFKDFTLKLENINILIGSNNSGKTTIINGLRILSVALEVGHKKTPEVKQFENKTHVYTIPKMKLPIPLENIHNDYNDSNKSYIEFTFENGALLSLHFPEKEVCYFTTDIDGYEVKTKEKFNEYFPSHVIQIPILGPLEDEEKMLKEETIVNGIGTQRASRHFRNRWLLNDDNFEQFADLIRTTWPGMEIEKPEFDIIDNRVTMYCKEDQITREIYWVGYGFQIWCQLLSYMTRTDGSTTLVVDEPDIYLHPDLQKHFVKIIRTLECQVVLATHSTAILNEAKTNEVILIDKNTRKSRRMKPGEIEISSTLSNEKLFDLVVSNESLIKDIISSDIRNEDLVSLGYRKKQLDIFRQYLDDDWYFENTKSQLNASDERVWQQFFEKNPWIFGYGLGYIFMSNLDGKKLEQVVKGFDLNSFGKRSDGVMKSMGAISNLCFIEIKTHKTELLEKQEYRTGCWSQSKELNGGLAQVRITVDEALRNISGELRLEDEDGNLTGEELYNYKPKSYLIVGSLKQLRAERGVNKNKLRSFELFRNNQKDIDIITFDELYERARFIVYNNQIQNE
jgi:energy-coupling factor transporter ATP-binding protein EcfA2